MLFFHEKLKKKEKEAKEQIEKFKKLKLVHDLSYDVEEELSFWLSDEMGWWYSGSTFFRFLTAKTLPMKNGEFVEKFYQSVNPICEEHGFSLNTDKSVSKEGEINFTWSKGEFNFSLSINTSASCTKIKIGSQPVYKYVCS